MNNYLEKFKNKVVFCNCDDPFESNFVKYFLMNFNKLGLKELIAAGYKTNFIDDSKIINIPCALRISETTKYLVGTKKDFDIKDIEYFFKTNKNQIMIPLTGNAALDENGNQIQISIKRNEYDEKGNLLLDRKGNPKQKIINQNLYYEAGDFRSDMSIAFLKEADIVVTNPPFSLFREYVTQLIEYKKNFLIIGNQNAIAYKKIFPLIKDNQIWFGNNFVKIFTLPDGTIKKFGNILWFTNLDHIKRHQMLPLNLKFKYAEYKEMYLKYFNFNAINVDKVSEIPSDYNGIMGVPISFLDKYCPEQFIILGCYEPAIKLSDYRKISKFKSLPSRQVTINGVLCQKTYLRIFIQKKNL